MAMGARLRVRSCGLAAAKKAKPGETDTQQCE
jgi:hypothetical protein